MRYVLIYAILCAIIATTVMSCQKDVGEDPPKRIIVCGIVIDALTKQPLSDVNIGISNGSSDPGYTFFSNSYEYFNKTVSSSQSGTFLIDYYTDSERYYNEIDINASSGSKLITKISFSKQKGWPGHSNTPDLHVYANYNKERIYHEKNTDSIFYPVNKS